MAPVYALPLMLPDEATRIQRDGLPPAEGEARLDRLELLARMRSGANDTFTDLLVIGWSAGAITAVLSDPVLCSKQITWLVRSGQLAHLNAAASVAAPAAWRVAICDAHAQLPYLLEFMPPCFSISILDEKLCPPNELMILGRNRFQRSSGSIHRLVKDFRHLWHRLELLKETTPLSAWRDYFTGRTALCLAAGPSLDQHIDFIRAHQERCVVLVVDVLQKKVQERGIKIDFVLTVDSDERLTQRMTAPSDPETVMIMPYNGHRDLDERFPKRSHFGHGHLARWLLGPDCIFMTGTTVGITSVGFAKFLGCTNAVLIGHDLAFSDEAYYSDLVAGREQHQAEMSAESNLMRRTVPGNNGSTVVTDYLFEVGIQDLAMMIRRMDDFPVYNMNIATGCGAKIAGTQRLPEDWKPSGDGPAPRPISPRKLDDIAPDLQRLTTEMLSIQMDNIVKHWQVYRSEGYNAVQIQDKLNQDTATCLGMAYLGSIIAGPVLLQMRLLSLPPSIGTAWHRQQLEQFILEALLAGRKFFDSLFTAEDMELAPDRHRTIYTPEQARFFAILASSLGDPVESPADAILLISSIQSMRDMRLAVPTLTWPDPQSALQALFLVRHGGDTVPRRFLIQTCCLCVLEGHREPMEWIRTSGILPPELVPDVANGGKRKRGEWPELDATEAVLRIRAGNSRSLRADGKLGLAWYPCQLHLIRALLERGEGGIGVIEKLLRSRELELDDQQMGLILLHTPDVKYACNLIQPFTAQLGEASQVAMARRQFDSGSHEAAEKAALGIRLLSRFRDQALDIIIHSRLGRGIDPKACLEVAREIVARELREDWIRRLSGGDWMAQLELLRAGNHLYDVGTMASLIGEAWKAQDRRALEDLYIMLLLRERHGDDAESKAHFTKLFSSTMPLLVKLGSDPAALVAAARIQEEHRGSIEQADMRPREEMRNGLLHFIAMTYKGNQPVAADESLFMSGLIDSLGMAQLLVFIKKSCGVELDAQKLSEKDVDTIDGILDEIHGHTS